MSRQKALIDGRRIATGLDASRVRDWTVRTIACVGLVWTVGGVQKESLAQYPSSHGTRTVAYTGFELPDVGTPFGEHLLYPTIDNYGRVTFRADVEAEDATQGIFWGFMPEAGSDPNRLQALQLAVSPSGLDNPTIGPNGHTAFAYYDASMGDWMLRVYTPGTGFTTIAQFSSGFSGPWQDMTINAIGHVVWRDSRDVSSIWTGAAGTASEALKFGDDAPDAASQTFTGFSHPVMNYQAAGSYPAFSANLNTGDSGVWKAIPGGGGPEFHKVAITDDSAPGLTGITFDEFPTGFRYGNVGINNDGYTTFKATLKGTGVTQDNDGSVWKETAGGLVLVARNGTNLPGASYSGIDGDTGSTFPVINHAGDVAFYAGAGVNEEGIWSEGITHSLHKVAKYGDAAPGITGATFIDFNLDTSNIISGGPPIAINSLGQVAFFANVTGEGIDSLNNGGIWIEDTAGQLLLAAREGENLTLDGNTWTILTIAAWPFHAGGEDGKGTYFNDCGEVAFRVILTDDGTIFGNQKEAILVRGVRLAGDVNDDGVVNIFDINFISSHWLATPPLGTLGDANYDGVVNIFDINMVSSTWGDKYADTCLYEEGGATAVPEPASLAIAGLALLGLVPIVRR